MGKITYAEGLIFAKPCSSGWVREYAVTSVLSSLLLSFQHGGPRRWVDSTKEIMLADTGRTSDSDFVACSHRALTFCHYECSSLLPDKLRSLQLSKRMLCLNSHCASWKLGLMQTWKQGDALTVMCSNARGHILISQPVSTLSHTSTQTEVRRQAPSMDECEVSFALWTCTGTVSWTIPLLPARGKSNAMRGAFLPCHTTGQFSVLL